MPLEYDHLRVKLNSDLIEAFRVPLKPEQSQADLFEEANLSFQKAGKRIRGIWGKALTNGLFDVLAAATVKHEPIPYASIDQDGEEVAFEATFLGEEVDRLRQPVDVFRLTPESAKPEIYSFKVATKRTPERFADLVILIHVDRTHVLTSHAFHFKEGNLFSILQSSRSRHLFRSLPDSAEQFILAQLGQARLLTVVAGSDTSQHLYQNLRGEGFRTYRARVMGGNMRLLETGEDGIVYITKPFNIPKAIENMSQFETATAA